MKFKLLQGQVLVELLLALVVSSLALVAMTQVATKSLANSDYSRNRSEANKYAVEAIEWFRDQRANWTTFTSHTTGTYCLGTLGFNPYPCSETDSVPGTIFTRRALFTNTGSQVIVEVTVSWDEKGRTTSSKQTIIFKQY